MGNPTSAAAWGRYCMILHAHAYIDEAVTCYRHSHELDPRTFRWVYLEAICRDYRGDSPEEVLQVFEKAIALKAGSPTAHFRYADVLFKQGKLEEARVAYSRAIELKPGFALAHRNLGQVLLSLKADGAREQLEQAYRLAPEDSNLLRTLARVYMLHGETDRASEFADRALKGRKTTVRDIEMAAVNRRL